MATPTATWFKTANNTLGSGTITITLTDVASGTPILVCTNTDFGAPADLTTPTGTAVSDWTDAANLKQTSSVAASGEPQMKLWAGLTVTAGGTVIGHGPADSAFGMIVAVLSGVDTATFPDGSAEAHGPATPHASTHTAAAVSPTGSDDLLIVFAQAADSDGGTTTTTGVYSGTAGMTNRARITFDSGTTRFMDVDAFDEVLAASGSTGTRALTYDDTTNWATITIAVKGTAAATGKAPAFISQHSYF